MIFLCHSSKDKPSVRRVATALKVAGISVWLDDEQIGFGDNIVVKISEGLAASELILVFLSENFLNSEWVKHEWSNLFFEEVNRRITKVIPVMIGNLPDELPAPITLLRAKRYVDLRNPASDSALTTFVDYLKSRCSSVPRSKAASVDHYDIADLQIRAMIQTDGSVSIRYSMAGMDIAKSSIASGDVEGTLSKIAMHFPRVNYRFGEDSTAAIEDVARRVSAFLIPPQVRDRIRSNSIRRIQILIDGDDPPLPWELAHDGDGFLGLRIPIINTPVNRQGKRSSGFSPNGIVIVEGVPDTYGIELGGFLARYLTNIQIGNMSLGRVQARSLTELTAIMERDAYDIIHYAGHTVTGPYMHFLLGDDRVSVQEFCAALGNVNGDKLVVLDSCESASCFPYNRPSFQNNPAYLLALSGFHAVGTVGWLEMTTSDHFNQRFYESLSNCMNIETAMLNAKRMLANEQKDWWVFSHFGTITD